MAKKAAGSPSKPKGKNWIAGAISKPGALTKQAKAAGQTAMEFAEEHKGDKGKTGERARLAVTLGNLRKKKGK